MAEEATINPDGTQEMPPVDPPMEAGADDIPVFDNDTIQEVAKGMDPAIFLLIAAVLVIGAMLFFSSRKKKDSDDFFDDLDGDKVRDLTAVTMQCNAMAMLYLIITSKPHETTHTNDMFSNSSI